MTLVVMIALSHVEIGGDIVQRTFLIILAGLMLAFALAFGLGGKEWAASLLQRWWPHDQKPRDL
jgi:TRAP-type C4-dicarboxylate transport system permease small subunit